MDAFEQVVSEILWMEGYWVRPSFKVELTKEEKIRIGRHSSPRWELDIIAYQASKNVLYVVECKSYLDSVGVTAAAFDGSNQNAAEQYKLFNESVLRKTIFGRLSKQLMKDGLCHSKPRVHLALVCGKIKSDIDRIKLHRHFRKKGWKLWDEAWLRSGIQKMARQGYENQVAVVVAKLASRN